jgi:hypothetical protein
MVVGGPEVLVDALNEEGEDEWEYCFHLQLVRPPSSLSPGTPPAAVLMIILKKVSVGV